MVAPNNVRTAMIVTPMGRFKLLPFLEQFTSNKRWSQTAPLELGEAVWRSDLVFSETPASIVIWMAVAPVPVILLLLMVPRGILVILLVPFFQVAPVGAVFAFIPIVVVMVARIVDSDLNAGFLGRCSGHDGSACHKGSREK